MNVPKWEKPTWIGLTPQKIRSMSEVEIRGMLKQACSSISMMPDHVPYKKYMVDYLSQNQILSMQVSSRD